MVVVAEAVAFCLSSVVSLLRLLNCTVYVRVWLLSLGQSDEAQDLNLCVFNNRLFTAYDK
jgi:hypothetical protein